MQRFDDQRIATEPLGKPRQGAGRDTFGEHRRFLELLWPFCRIEHNLRTLELADERATDCRFLSQRRRYPGVQTRRARHSKKVAATQSYVDHGTSPLSWVVAAASELNRSWHKTATWTRCKRQALATHLPIADWISL